MDEKKIIKAVRNANIERMLKDENIRKQVEEELIEFVDVGVPNLWGHFRHGVWICGEGYWKKRVGRNRRDI